MYRPPAEGRKTHSQEVDVKPYLIVSVEADASQLSDEKLRKVWSEQDSWMGEIEVAIKQTLGRYFVNVDTNVVLIDHNARLGKLRKRR